MAYSKEMININPEKECERIINQLQEDVGQKLRKRGAVIGISGGIDSSVVLALCYKAFGADRVLAVGLPEKDSSDENYIMTNKLLDKFPVSLVVEDMTPALYGFQAYQRRDEAIKHVFPEYDLGYRVKIGVPAGAEKSNLLNIFHITIISPEEEEKTARLPLAEYLQIVAASNFKQRSRMCMLYYHAERLNYAVIGTGNKNEHELGFFVKWGDGGTDVKPITHLFKTQVFQLAAYLGIPEEIQQRTPTTDTYSAEQTQEEFFFRLPFDILDVIWYGWEQQYSVEEIAACVDMTAEQVEFVIADIQRKKATTEYLRMAPL